MVDIAHRAVDHGARLALTPADRGRDAPHAGDARHALDDEHVAGLGEVVRFDLAQARGRRTLVELAIEHSERLAGDARARVGGPQHRARHGARHAAFIERVGSGAREVLESEETGEQLARQTGQLEQSESTAIQPAQKRLARHRMIVTMASFHPSPSKPKLALPHGACDTHFHVFGPRERYPFAAERSYTPAGDAPKETLFALHAHLGIGRGVVVQSAAHGFDNSAAADLIAHGKGRYVGVALVPTDIGERELQELNAQGFCGARFHYMDHLGSGSPIDEVLRFAQRLAPLGWHLQIHLDAKRLDELAPALKRSPVPVVIDHMARIDASLGLEQKPFGTLLRLLEDPQRLGEGQRLRARVARARPLARRLAVRAQARRRMRQPRAVGHRLAASQPQGSARRRPDGRPHRRNRARRS